MFFLFTYSVYYDQFSFERMFQQFYILTNVIKQVESK